jgi:hypothetical protein
MSEFPFRTAPLDFTGKEVISSYRTGNYKYVYEVRRGSGSGWIVWRNDGLVLGDFGTEDQAREAIPGFEHQDYLFQIQQWNHLQAHGIDSTEIPLPLKEL